MRHELQITQAETWAFYVPAKIPHTVTGIVGLGRVFIDAKAALSEAEFARLHIERLAPFGRRSISGLMAIAHNAALANIANATRLPAHFSVLCYLATLPPALIETALTEQRLTATSTKRDAIRLYRVLKPTPKPPRPVSTAEQREARLQTMREMAADGARSDQIAAQVHLHTHTCRAIMRKHGIDCVADRVVGRARKLNADRIAESLVHSAASIAEDVKLIDFAQLTPDRLPDFSASLKSSMKAIVKLIIRLDAEKERRHAPTEAQRSVAEKRAQGHGGTD